jgi:hypothetical protein
MHLKPQFVPNSLEINVMPKQSTKYLKFILKFMLFSSLADNKQQY